MKVVEDKAVATEGPSFRAGGYYGVDPFLKPEDFKLSEVKFFISPYQLELVFIANHGGQQKSGWFKPKEGSTPGMARLGEYKKEIEEKLIGQTWNEVLVYDFLFSEAEFTN